jgi:two-component system CheB/CheR fusion protein
MGRKEDKGNERMRRERPKKKAETADALTDEQQKRRQERLVRQEMKSGEKYMTEQDKKRAWKQPEEEEEPAEAAQEEPEPAEHRERAGCPIVGVGASAGGLEALQGLLDHVRNEPPMAFVVVQHRATDRTSVMKSLVEKHTSFRVRDIDDGMKVEPGTIYLAPADKDVSIMNATFYLVEPPQVSGLRLPIDAFLRSLAQEEAARATAIILSGTGSDGTLGVKEVKGAGGMIMVQKEDQAKYDSMPRSAIDTGMVDFILPVEQMGAQLAQYLTHPFLALRKTPEMGKKVEGQLQKVFLLIRHETGHDFSHYKRNTILRRVSRRLAVHQIDNLEDYLKLLTTSSEEVAILARELLITVTNFFRDHNAFTALQEHVIRPLVTERPSDRPIRIWVAGCATGEEAYSIAVLLMEEMGKAERHHPVQIFATDLDEGSVEMGRRGLYPKSIAGDVSPERLKRFFTEENNHYKVRGNIREMIVFAKHNLIKDAPFSKLDLVCCRNVLIYMDSTLQKKLLPMFHFTLNTGGYLFLGESESIGTFADLYAPVDAKHKIFRRKPVQTGYQPEGQAPVYPAAREAKGKPPAAKPVQDFTKVAERVILRDYSLPCVLVDEEYNIVYFNGDISPYLIQPGGRPTTNIIQMARPEVHYRLSLLLKRATHEKHMALEKDIQLRTNDHYIDVDIMARPIVEPGIGENLMLVVFKSKPKERKPGEEAGAAVEIPEQEKDTRIRELEQELQSTKEYLQTTIEELETSNEELKSANEELQSTNEELQSTNEEVDTSREELQSTNEELRTVNSEHQQKIDELSKAYDDLTNLLGATEVATIFLDHDLRIRRFTPAARKLFRLIDRDIGRPLDDITTNLKYDGLLADVRTVLETLTRVEKEIPGDNDECYQMKVIPYRTAENVIEGVVVTFLDISEQKKIIAASEEASGLAKAIVETVREPLLILDEQLKVLEANPAFYAYFRTRPEETLRRRVYDLGNRQWDIPALRELLEKIIPENSRFEDFRVAHRFPGVGERTMLLNARQVTLKGEATGRILLAMEDVTGRAAGETGKESRGPA